MNRKIFFLPCGSGGGGCLFFLSFLAILIKNTNVFVSADPTTTESSSRKKEILDLQKLLISSFDDDNTAKAAIEQQLDDTVIKEADYMHQKFNSMALPGDRLDDPSKNLKVGTHVWYLLVIPQWFITATIVEVVNNNDNEQQDLYRVRLTAGNSELNGLSRGSQIRAVRQEDESMWESQYLRDTAESYRQQHQATNDEGYNQQRLLHYQKSIEVNSNNPHPYDNMGIYYSDRGDYHRARHAYEQSIQVSPTWYHAYYNYGSLLRDHKEVFDDIHNNDRTLLLFEDAYKLNPLFLDSLWNIANENSKLGRYEEECYHWRLLKVLNQYQYHITWNSGWESYTTERIQLCVKNIIAAAGAHHNGEL